VRKPTRGEKMKAGAVFASALLNIVKQLIFGTTALVLTLISTIVLAAGKPNIVFIFADHLGYGELGSYGGGHALATRLSRLIHLIHLSNSRVGKAPSSIRLTSRRQPE
jgi:hypothetical protein